MKTFKIRMQTPFGRYTICEWEAETAIQAMQEFLELNPCYENKGYIIAE